MKRLEYIASLIYYIFPFKRRSPRLRKVVDATQYSVVVIIPSYRPSEMTRQLVMDICRFNEDLKLKVILVDDSSPKESRSTFKQVRANHGQRVTIIRTPTNRLKAGAINFALQYMQDHDMNPEVVFTMDDDIAVRPRTIKSMIRQLFGNPKLGAVCSLAQVANKNENLLTRLQGLEYNSFNIIRVADNNYIQGPLVMHGMAAAFRYTALQYIGGFATDHLIEDYDVTARLKNVDWHVALASDAQAYTLVPETWRQLWKQRVRWSTGGVKVLMSRHKIMSIFQDIIGHSLFLSTLLLICLSLLLPFDGQHSRVAYIIFAVSIASFLLNYIFSLYILVYYREGDVWDLLIRSSIILELIYSLVLTLVQLGSYLFCAYNYICRRILRIPDGRRKRFDSFFKRIGFSETWGTR